MCELFGLCTNRPTAVSFRFEAFAEQGGKTSDNSDGWGVSFHAHHDARIIREPVPAAFSPWVRLLEKSDIESTLIVSHIRYATAGAVKLENTHPFSRELGGRRHVFAHNGALDGLDACAELALGRFLPMGDTDSERAFCGLLARMEPLWAHGVPPLSERLAVFTDFAAAARRLGQSNLLYCDSDALFVHADVRADEGEGPLPGLFLLRLEGPLAVHDHPGLRFGHHHAEQVTTVVASVPLSDEAWRPLPRGAALALKDGETVAG